MNKKQLDDYEEYLVSEYFIQYDKLKINFINELISKSNEIDNKLIAYLRLFRKEKH